MQINQDNNELKGEKEMGDSDSKHITISINSLVGIIIAIIFFFTILSFVFTIILMRFERLESRMMKFDRLEERVAKFGRLEERVDWNEDQLVQIDKWKTEVYQKAILKGGSNVSKTTD